MENNRFYQHRMAIKKVCDQHNVDIGVGSRMYAKEQGWTDWGKEMDEWNAIQRKYVQHPTKTLADLFK